MKKTGILFILFVFIISGCSQTNIEPEKEYKTNSVTENAEQNDVLDKQEDKTEWLSDELIDMQLQAQQHADEETKYMTSEEKDRSYNEYYKNKLKELGYPFGKDIQIRGIYNGETVGVITSEITNCSIICGFDIEFDKDNEYSAIKCFFMQNDMNIFWNVGETVLFKTTVSNYGDFYNSYAISPINPNEFRNNVFDLYSEYIQEYETTGKVFDLPDWVMGYVDTEIAITNVETKKQLEEILCCDIYDYNTSCYIVTSGNDDASFFILANGDYFNQGDCVGFSCTIECVPIENAGIFVGTIYEFDKKYTYKKGE